MHAENVAGCHGSKSEPLLGDDLPVEELSWRDCQAFVGKLRDLEDGWRFSLPTEAQWEYACRAGSTGPYVGNLEAMAWYKANSGETTYPADARGVNAWGSHDMHGNVSEWRLDAYTGNLPGESTRS